MTAADSTICPWCSGSGEGRDDGTFCGVCRGLGHSAFEAEPETAEPLNYTRPGSVSTGEVFAPRDGSATIKSGTSLLSTVGPSRAANGSLASTGQR